MKRMLLTNEEKLAIFNGEIRKVLEDKYHNLTNYYSHREVQEMRKFWDICYEILKQKNKEND